MIPNVPYARSLDRAASNPAKNIMLNFLHMHPLILSTYSN